MAGAAPMAAMAGFSMLNNMASTPGMGSGSNKKERLFVRDKILGSRDTIDNLFLQSQADQMAAIDSAISGAQSYASTQANAKTAGSGMGASNIDGTMGYVMNNIIPQAMQMRAGIYADTSKQRVASIEDYLQLLNQNAGMSGGSTQGTSPLGGFGLQFSPTGGLTSSFTG